MNDPVGQAKFLEDSLLRKMASEIALPTDPDTINLWFKEIREPIIMFGETLLDRRKRLGLEIAKRGGLDALPRLKSFAESMKGKMEPKVVNNFHGKRSLSDDIVTLRRQITHYWFKNGANIQFPDYSSRPDASYTLEIVGLNEACNRPCSSLCSVNDFIAVSERNGSIKLLDDSLDSIVFSIENLESTGHLSSFDNGILCSGFDGHIRLYDHDAKSVTNVFQNAHLNSRVNQCSWHPSGEYFASCGSDGRWNYWNVNTSTPLFSHYGHHVQMGIKSTNVDNAGGALVASGGGDGVMRIWDTRIGRCIMTGSKQHVQAISSIASLHGCLFVTGGLDNKLVAWDLRRVQSPLHTMLGHTQAITNVHIAKSLIMSSSLDGHVKLWHLNGTPACSYFIDEQAKPMSFCYKGDRVYTCGLDKTVRSFELVK